MHASSNRAAYVEHLRKLYGLGVKDRENAVASYDLYLGVMQAGLSIRGLVNDILTRQTRLRVLDVGCGDAGVLKALLSEYPNRVEAYGVDLVVPSHGPEELNCAEGDALRMQFPANCDLIFSFRAMHEIGAVDVMVSKVAGALAQGGRAFLSIRMSEFENGRVEPQGRITPSDVQWLRAIATRGNFDGVKLRCAEVAGRATTRSVMLPGAAAESHSFDYLRGCNVFLERLS